MFDSVIDYVFNFVKDNGIQVDSVTWRYKGLDAVSCDDGETIGIIWGPRLNVFQRVGDEPTYSCGEFDDLMVVYCGLFEMEIENNAI